MFKEKLHIYYDSASNSIKASFLVDKYKTSSAWRDTLQELLNNNVFKRQCYNNDLIVEYADIIIQIDDWKECGKDILINKYIQKVIVAQLHERINKVKEFNNNVSHQTAPNHSDEELLPDYIHKALIERKEKIKEIDKSSNYQANSSRQNSNIKVKRKNKYVNGVIPIVIVGTLTLSSLAGSMIVKHEDVKSVRKPDTVSIQTMNESMSHNRPYESDLKIDLNVDDLISNQVYSDEISLKYDNYSQTDKAISTRLNYGFLIEKYAKKCGIDPNIVLGIAIQESGNHELGLKSGNNGGLMQIEIEYWRGKEITYYDFEEKENYIIKIDDNITEVENNILIGCAILQNELKTFNYNIPLAIQSYNEGYSNMSKILDRTSINTGLTKTSIINDDHCLEWLNYTDIVNTGDPNYVNNVLSWTGYGYDFYELTCQKENGDIKVCTTIPIVNDFEKAI